MPISRQNRIASTTAGVLRDGASFPRQSSKSQRPHHAANHCFTSSPPKKGRSRLLEEASQALKRLSAGPARHWAQYLCLLGMLGLWGSRAAAHEVITTNITWGREISRVFTRRCISCHHNRGPAFDLSSYEQARPWAEAIKQEVLERRMPPWGAVKGFGDFRDEVGLSEWEITVISSWVEGGAPKGNLDLLPKQVMVKTEPSVPPKLGKVLLVSKSLTLARNVKIAAVRPEAVPEGASLRLIAERPNGAVEPLIWLYSYASRFRRTYYFKAPMSFGAGTRIRIQPAGGSVSLLLQEG